MTTIDDEHQYPRSDQSLIEQLQTQLIYNQLHRKQARDYTRKLSEYNMPPAAWYGTSFIPRSIYVYDPRYHKTVHQSISSLQRARSDLRVSNGTHIPSSQHWTRYSPFSSLPRAHAMN